MLLDHFRPPLSLRRNWKGFHNSWATYLSAEINRRLPEGWYATTEIEFAVEIDVATVDETHLVTSSAPVQRTRDGETWSPGSPTLVVALPVISDVVEILVFRTSGGSTLAGAVELVSPANKDRPDSREAFVAKCESYLVAGIGLVVVDIVTERHANLHRELLDRLDERHGVTGADGLYAASYRPVEREQGPTLEVWHEPLVIGGELPIMPLFPRGGPCIPVDLPTSYERNCVEQNIPRPS